MVPLWRGPTTGNLDPFRKTTALFSFNVYNVGVTTASTADAILFDRVRSGPVLIFFDSLLLVVRGLLEIRFARELARGGIGRAMLDRSVPIAKITEVVNVTRSKQSTSCKGVNRCITPLVTTVSNQPKKASRWQFMNSLAPSRNHHSDPSY